jgi:hypothetical protein
MKKSTLVFLIVFSLLLAYVIYSHKKNNAQSGETIPESKKIFSLSPSDIKAVSFTQEGKTIQLVRSGPNDWEMTSPIQDIADRYQAENLVDTLANLQAKETISRKENVSAYGLGKNSTLVVVQTKNGQQQTLRVGGKSPTGEGYYAFVPANGEIVLIPNDIGQILQTPLDSWRSHTLFSFVPSQIEKIEISSTKNSFAFVQKHGEWQIEDSRESLHGAKADSAKVSSFLTTLANLRFLHFLSQKTKIKKPFLMVALWEKGEKKSQKVVVGAKTKEGYPALTEGRVFPYLLGDNVLKTLLLNPVSFRDLHLLSFHEDQITKLEIKTTKNDYVFQKVKNDWKLVSPPKARVEAWKAGLVVDDVKGLEEVTFPEKLKAGFSPVATISLWSQNGLVGQVMVGEKVVKNKVSAYPVHVFPAQKNAWANADLLMKDLP